MGLSCFDIKICGAVLAGGQAGRLGGIAKGLLSTGQGGSMIDNAMSQMRKAGVEDVVISANEALPYKRFGVDVVSDLGGRIVGPLGGIEAVLDYYNAKCEGVLVMPCDLPNITSKEIYTLIDRFVVSGTSVVCARAADGCHPLCAVIRTAMLGKVSTAIEMGQRRIMGLWFDNDVSVVDFASDAAFYNINTPADVDRRLLIG